MNFYSLFFSVQTLPSVIIAILLFIWGRPRKKYFWVKLVSTSLAFTAIYSVAWYYVKVFVMENGTSMYSYLMIACNIGALILLLLLCWTCFDCSFTDYFVYIVCGWVTQHIAGMISNIVAKLCNIELNYVDYDWRYFMITIISYACVYLIVWLWFGKTRRNGQGVVNKRIYIPAIILLVVVIALNIFAPTELETGKYIVVKCYAISCCVVSLFLVFGAFENGRLENEIAIMEELDKKKSQQYIISKESMDVINTRYHDLKKLMGILTSEGKSLPKDELERLNEELNYQSVVAHTGNKALDTVCTEKGLYCRKNSIELDILVNAPSLSMISDLDIYSMFSNVLDNAIEAQMKLEEDKRMINMSVKETNGLIVIHCDNPYDGNIKVDNNKFITTKNDAKKEHGFGIMSIKRVVSKYGGEISITSKDEIFNLDIVIPISINKQ